MKRYSQEFRRYVALNLIHTLGPVSRTELADISGFRPATVGELAKSLIDEGLVLETGTAASPAGRRRTMLELNGRGIGAIGIAVSRKRATAVLARLDGSIVREEHCERPPEADEDGLIERIVGCAEALRPHADGMRLVGIGIGDPLYDPSSYKNADSLSTNYGHFNDWVHLRLKPRLEARFGLPVRTLSAVTLPALVERQYGMAKGSDNFICVELSNGIGASIVCNGVALSGAHGVAGELGHTVIDLSGQQLCYCGKPGCAELGASFPELRRDIAQAVARGAQTSLSPDDITVETLREALEAGDRLCRFYVDRAARRAGTAIANAVNVLNPDRVVLYGYMLELGNYYLDQLRDAIRGQTLEISGDYEICASPALESKLPLGAAAEVFARFLRSQEYRWVTSMLGEREKNT